MATPLSHDEQEDFRISLAGAQEKTALFGMAGAWFRPHHATPTTHIFKLPLGIIGGFRGDFSDSVENEWLCAQVLRELGLPVADAAIAHFGDQRALVVTRFDRRWMGVDAAEVQKKRFTPRKGTWIARLPQEDLCQAMGLPPTLRYEADGGPSMQDALTLLASSEHPTSDQTNFALAQVAFWLLAATDGHGKNFSLRQHAGGTYGLTPLYDVLSAWPIIGHGKNQLAIEKAKLAMALRGRRAHYRLNRDYRPPLAGVCRASRSYRFVESHAVVRRVRVRRPRARRETTAARLPGTRLRYRPRWRPRAGQALCTDPRSVKPPNRDVQRLIMTRRRRLYCSKAAVQGSLWRSFAERRGDSLRVDETSSSARPSISAISAKPARV